MKGRYKVKHLLKLLDWTSEDIQEVLNLADQLKYEQKHGITKNYLAGKYGAVPDTLE